jgi:peroxiredoxin/DNA-binding transcriptional MerR regulator
MHASTAAMQSGVSIKALRYYESTGLIRPIRSTNGYRDYSEHDVALVRQIAELTALGLTVASTRPFIECLLQGHADGDDCVESLVAYGAEIKRLDSLISELTTRKNLLRAKLETAAQRGFPENQKTGATMPAIETYGLPENLPIPIDDGRTNHLIGLNLPGLSFPASDGSMVNLTEVSAERWVLFIYPTTGVPGEDLPRGWDEIPGARGCTPESCGFRDNLTALYSAGIESIFGFSGQATTYQKELVERLHLPYAMLSDPDFVLGDVLGLPTFQAGNSRFYKRITLILHGTQIQHVFYPIFPPNEHALRVLEWIETHPVTPQREATL